MEFGMQLCEHVIHNEIMLVVTSLSSVETLSKVTILDEYNLRVHLSQCLKYQYTLPIIRT